MPRLLVYFLIPFTGISPRDRHELHPLPYPSPAGGEGRKWERCSNYTGCFDMIGKRR